MRFHIHNHHLTHLTHSRRVDARKIQRCLLEGDLRFISSGDEQPLFIGLVESRFNRIKTLFILELTTVILDSYIRGQQQRFITILRRVDIFLATLNIEQLETLCLVGVLTSNATLQPHAILQN